MYSICVCIFCARVLQGRGYGDVRGVVVHGEEAEKSGPFALQAGSLTDGGLFGVYVVAAGNAREACGVCGRKT